MTVYFEEEERISSRLTTKLAEKKLSPGSGLRAVSL